MVRPPPVPAPERAPVASKATRKCYVSVRYSDDSPRATSEGSAGGCGRARRRGGVGDGAAWASAGGDRTTPAPAADRRRPRVCVPVGPSRRATDLGPLARRDGPSRGGVRPGGRPDGGARPRLDRGAAVLDQADLRALASGLPRCRVRPPRARSQRQGAHRRLHAGRLRRRRRGGATPVRPAERAGGAGGTLAGRDVDRGVGRAPSGG